MKEYKKILKRILRKNKERKREYEEVITEIFLNKEKEKTMEEIVIEIYLMINKNN